MTKWVYNGQPDPSAGGVAASCAPASALVDGKPIAVVCKKIEQATTDENGASGFSATPVGSPRVWTYTYNQWGQVLTATGPRGNVDSGSANYAPDTTTNVYYSDTTADHMLGDLASSTDALGHTTTYPKYDRNGRLLKAIDANGVSTEYTYHVRGWLTQVQRTAQGATTSEVASYEYWPTGLLKKATQPDGTWAAYTYDAAHRLTDVADNQGNSVHYTLDAMGNRTQEDYKDPSGTLRRTITRVIDALNRVQTVSGAPL